MSDNITLEPEQNRAAKLILNWFYASSIIRFILGGWAGTGKTTVLTFVRDTLGLKPSEIMFLAPTGKAAMVLRRKGLPAITMHQFMYVPEGENDEPILGVCPSCKDSRMVGIGDIAMCVACGHEEPFDINDVILKNMKRKRIIKFRRRDKSELPPGLKLLVVDEASMINIKMRDDIESFDVMCLYSGDPGQLDPVEGKGIIQEADFVLQEVRRQAENNSIISVSKLVRERQKLDYGRHGRNVWVLTPEEANVALLLKADQVLCGKNDTRRDLTFEMREAKGFTGHDICNGDKIMCVRNNWKKGLFNGQIGTAIVGQMDQSLEEAFGISLDQSSRSLLNALLNSTNNQKSSNRLTIGFTDEDGMKFPYIDIDKEVLQEQKEPGFGKGSLEYFKFADTISVHKSQGSEWPRVVLWEEQFMSAEKHARLMYTGITRASQQLVIIKERKHYY
jgi:exodeoxyribonuclease-5